jgi:hypothetical protein
MGRREIMSVSNYFSPCISQEIKKAFKHFCIFSMDVHGMVWLHHLPSVGPVQTVPSPLPQAEKQCKGNLAR